MQHSASGNIYICSASAIKVNSEKDDQTYYIVWLIQFALKLFTYNG